MQKKYQVGVVILNWNNWPDTKICIDFLKKSISNSDNLIIVVDNGSSDDSVENLRELKDIVLLESKSNLGFSGGCNLGIKYCVDHFCDYIVLLNNDAVVSKDTILHMLSAMQRYRNRALIGSIVFNHDGSIQSAGMKINKITGRVEAYKQFNVMNRIDYITGCCLLLPINFISEVGYFDDNFFLYWEDADLSIRANLAGYKLVIDPQSMVFHKDSASTKDNPYIKELYYNLSQLLFMKKHHYTRLALTNVFFRLIKCLMFGEWVRLRAVVDVWFLGKRKL